MPEVKPAIESLAKIKVVGVGGSGGSAINRMIQSKIKGVDFIAINTDLQALHCNQAPIKVHIGKTVTRGLGAGMNPEQGYKAAEENQNEIREVLKGADMIFITCGLGGGTGSGASPLVADIAKGSGALTVAVVTKPFTFEGAQRRDIAERSHAALLEKVDTIITIPNDRILQIIDKKASMLESFQAIDDVLRQGVQGISEVITIPGLINVDFADVRTIMQDTGSALMGIGRASGENKVLEAAKAAITSPLLDLSIEGAKGILFIVTGNSNLGMHEVADAAKVITGTADENAKIIFGTVIDDNLKDEVKITVIATGFERRADHAGTRVQRAPKSPFARPEETVFGNKPISSASAVNTPAESESRPSAQKAESNMPIFGNRGLSSTFNNIKRPTTPPPPTPLPADESVADSDDEDLEIPTFIRRKMM